MSLRHALLGLLAEEPASGYDLTKKFERALQRYAWHAQHSQVYPELNRLAADDLVEVVAEGARGRRTYTITDAGRAELRTWMLNPPEVFVSRNEFVLRMFLLSALDTEDARALLRSIAEGSARKLAALRERIDAGDPFGIGPVLGPLVAEFGARSFQTTRDWALWALNRIDADAAARGTSGLSPASRYRARDAV